MAFISCNYEEENNNINQVNFKKVDKIYLLHEDRKYEIQNNDSIIFYDYSENFEGIIKSTNDYTLHYDNQIETNNEVIISSPNNIGCIKIQNIRRFNDDTIFDVRTSNGLELNNFILPKTEAIVPIIRTIVKAVVRVIGVKYAADTVNGTQEDCTRSMPKDCPQGTAPYAIYNSGWFSSSCEVGCR